MRSISKFFGTIFQPIFHGIAWLLAYFYGLVPNYLFAIVLLTIVIMGVLTPLTVKSTKSMMAMQKLQPEIKKLQQKYKGPENRQTLNDEMMKLYREEGVNPVGGCLPMLLQAPFLFILYSVIKGLAFTTTNKAGKIKATPRYIPHHGAMYWNLIHSGGQIKVWGMDLSLKPFPISAHGTFLKALPFFIFVAVAVALQYFQMAQLNNRNRKTGQAMPSQQQAMQRVLPLIFAFFYLAIPSAVVVYMIISTGIRIITQDIMFRTGVSNPHHGKVIEKEREIPAPKEIDAASDVVEAPTPKLAPKPAPKAPTNQPRPKPGPKNQSRPAKPQSSQARSRAKRKRKAR
jgi:YidC/Oxa1 family membrane protein insertase